MKCKLQGNKLYFDEYFYIDLNKQTIDEFELRKKIEITIEEYRELIRRRAYSMGYFLLARRDYSSQELYQYLVKKYREKKIIQELIDEFIEKGYIDDYEYGKNYIKSHKYSKRKMEFMLLKKGISSCIIKELLKENIQDELEEVRRQWEKLGNRDENKKIASLMRKGFCYGDIQKVIRQIKEESEI